MSYKLYIYNEISKRDLDFEQVLTYLKQHCSFAQIEVRENFISRFYSPALIEKLADSWNNELCAERGFAKSEDERVYYEKQAHFSPSKTICTNVIYNGWDFLDALQAQLPREEVSRNQLHIFLTPRLLVTKDENDTRYHARTLLAGQLSIISYSGLIEAPARPTEYYFLERAYQMAGQSMPEEEIKEHFADKILLYHDTRINEVIKGYFLQAIAYRFFGEGFCKNPKCRLFNAHRQQEMLTAQLEPPEFCPRHKTLFSTKQ